MLLAIKIAIGAVVGIMVYFCIMYQNVDGGEVIKFKKKLSVLFIALAVLSAVYCLLS